MERISTIELALHNEEREKEFYLAQAKRSKNPVVVLLMETLAKEEDDHMTWINKVAARLQSDGTWPVELQVVDTELADKMKKLEYGSSVSKEHDDNDIDALKKAVEFEREAASFYSDLAAKSSDEKEKSFFDFLAKVEHKHMLSISDSLSYLEDPEAWFTESEHHGMDGA